MSIMAWRAPGSARIEMRGCMATWYEESSEAARQPRADAMLAQHVLGSVSAEVAVLDHDGKIVMINEAWERFARENAAGQSRELGVGANYLEICRSESGESAEGAKDVFKGLAEVLSGNRRDFSFEYPCHSHAVRRWFLLQATGIGLSARRGRTASHRHH
jgi:PAS domain-containing protein